MPHIGGTGQWLAAVGGIGQHPAMFSEPQRRFLAASRVAHLATADGTGAPHVVPVCYAFAQTTLYITIDDKPKRTGVKLRRLRNIAENPTVCVTVDRYDEDWSRLAWVMLRGRADILPDGAEHDAAQALLRARYPQLRTMSIERHPVIAVRPTRVTSWGNLQGENSA